MSESSVPTSPAVPGGWESFREELGIVWRRMPNRTVFLGLLGAWLFLFLLLGNSTIGYVDSPSLFKWLYQTYAAPDSQDSHGLLVPLVVLAGSDYGAGSSRDWAAKGTQLLGVRAVIASSFERIHRSNLVGMGILPLQLPSGQSWETLGISGRSVRHLRARRCAAPRLRADDPRHGRRRGDPRVPRQGPHRHAGRTGVLPQWRHSANGIAETGSRIKPRPAVAYLK